MTTILLNATAARTSGALTIITDFIKYLSTHKYNNCNFFLFTTVDVFTETDFLKIIKLQPQTWRTRIQWDNYGLQNWCKNNKIFPNLVISFQNTCSRFNTKEFGGNTPQVVYYHQTLPIVPYNWQWFRKSEFKLFLYAHFYKYFVNKNNQNAYYVVQLPYIKEAFLKKFNNILEEKVFVIRPNNPIIDYDFVNEVNFSDNKKRFIYPATPLKYKNHLIILKALKQLFDSNPKLKPRIQIFFTIPNEDNFITKEIRNLNLQENVLCLGSIPYNQLLSYYKSCDALLFPSKIESFGLPLVEASIFGLPILASELPYAKQVLEPYSNKVFCNPNDVDEWTNGIKQLVNKEKNLPLEKSKTNSWSDFMNLVFSIINTPT